MRRLAVLAALISLAVAAAPADAARPRALLVQCLRGAEQPDRAAVFEGQMSVRAGSERMQMRFRLRADDGSGWRAVQAPALDAWVTSDAGVRRYIFTKRVENLAAPGAYRMDIQFRWLDGDGRVVARAAATSPACRQPDLRPDLRVVALGGGPAGVYVVRVRNRGRGESPETDVVLTINGADQPAAALPALAPGERATLRILGPPCTDGSTVTVHVDARGAAEERDELDNVRALPCPAGASAALH